MKNKWSLNPILKKELTVGSRSIKMSLFVMGINLFLTIIVSLVMLVSELSNELYDYSNLISLFPILSCVECGLLSLIVPVFTASSISGERERQTLDIMLTTPMKPFSIVLGKLESAVIVTMMYMISSIPLLAVSFVLGGMSWGALLGLIVIMFYLGIYVGSIGVFCSSIVKKSVAATILTIVIGSGIMILTAIIFGMWNGMVAFIGFQLKGTSYSYQMGASLIVLMFNPYSPVFDFLMRTMTQESIYSMWQVAGKSSMVLELIYRAWIPISMVLNLLVAFGFLKMAAKGVAATKPRRKKE